MNEHLLITSFFRLSLAITIKNMSNEKIVFFSSTYSENVLQWDNIIYCIYILKNIPKCHEFLSHVKIVPMKFSNLNIIWSLKLMLRIQSLLVHFTPSDSTTETLFELYKKIFPFSIYLQQNCRLRTWKKEIKIPILQKRSFWATIIDRSR